MHHGCKFGENKSNTFQGIVLTMFRMHGQTDHPQTDSQTARIHNVYSHYVGGGIKKQKANHKTNKLTLDKKKRYKNAQRTQNYT